MIMKVEKEMKYEAPEVEILEVEVENGFGQSSTFSHVRWKISNRLHPRLPFHDFPRYLPGSCVLAGSLTFPPLHWNVVHSRSNRLTTQYLQIPLFFLFPRFYLMHNLLQLCP